MREWTILLLCAINLAGVAQAQRTTAGPCANARIHCFLPDDNALAASGPLPASSFSKPQMVTMTVRAWHGGVLAHQWIELDTPRGKVTIGYGPASIPFIDAGQISIWDENGNIEHSGLRLLPTNFNYAKPPGEGRLVGAPIPLTVAQADRVLQKESRRKRIFPYIPIFHDCHTFVCTVKATANGKSTLPCYLLFKGYW